MNLHADWGNIDIIRARVASQRMILEATSGIGMSDEFLRSIQSEKLRQLYQYWIRQSPAAGGPPRARDLDVQGLAAWARNLIVIEVRPQARFRYGFYGTTFRKAFGVDMTGAIVEDLPAAQSGILTAEYRMVRRTQRPYWRVYAGWFGPKEEPQTWERLSLPLLDQKGEVAFILAAAYRADVGRALIGA